MTQTPRIAIYTAIFGRYDNLKLQTPQIPSVDFLCFTDTDIQDPQNWRVIHVPSQDNARLQAKYYKLLPHLVPELQNYDAVIWIDGSMQITRDDFATWILSHIQSSGWAIFAHHEMNCLYDEAAAMARTVKYAHMPIREQSEYYRSENCPAKSGLYMAGLIARNMHHPQWRDLCDAWWKENTDRTLRDQISLPYVLWKHNGALDVIPGNPYACDYFSVDNAHRQHEYMSIDSMLQGEAAK